MDKVNVMSNVKTWHEAFIQALSDAGISPEYQGDGVFTGQSKLYAQVFDAACEWQSSRQALEGEPTAIVDGSGILQWYPPYNRPPAGTKLYTHPAGPDGAEVWEKAMMAAIGEDGPKSVSDAIGRLKAGSVPEGWKIRLHADGVTVLFPGTRGGVHITTDSPHNDIADNVLHDLALALICGSQPGADTGIPVSGLGQRKAAQVGTTIGVLVQRDGGRFMAITDLGRCTMLNQDVTGAGLPEGKKFWLEVNEFAMEYVDGYEFRGDDGDYMPSETEKFWITDCVAGLLQQMDEKGWIATPTKADEQVSVPESVIENMSKIIDILNDLQLAEGKVDTCHDYPNKNPALQNALVHLAQWLPLACVPAKETIALGVAPTKAAVKPSGFGDMNDMELQEWANTCRRAKQEQGQ